MPCGGGTKTPHVEHQESTLLCCSSASNVSPLSLSPLKPHCKHTSPTDPSRLCPAASERHNGTWCWESGWAWSGSGLPSRHQSVVSQLTPKKWAIVYTRGGESFIRSATTWNYWHMEEGFEVLWHKDTECNRVCFHRIWPFSGKNRAARHNSLRKATKISKVFYRIWKSG